jgi:hypothetical protein
MHSFSRALPLVLSLTLASAGPIHAGGLPDDDCNPLLDPGCGLVLPDPADLPRINDATRPITLNWDDIRCGSERVERCEDLGGDIEIVDGAGCESQQQLVTLGLQNKSSTLVRLNGRQKLGATFRGELVPLSPTLSGPQLQTLAVNGRLVKLDAVARDRARPPRRRVPAPAITVNLDTTGCDCTCVVWDMVDPQVSNARKGDVGLVPVADGGGEEVVRVVMNALGQNHRHAVMFVDKRTLRHNTSYDEIDDDDLQTNKLLNPSVLRNGRPGFTTESVDAALGTERLGWSGLVLKVPADDRPRARDAVDIALAADGYYKISNYSELTGWTLDYASPSSNRFDTDNLRGTMCSGLVYHSFRDAGFSFSSTVYPERLRDDVARVLFDTVKAEIKSSLSWSQAVGSFLITGTAKHIANQVTNCFAGLGCADNGSTWKRGTGQGTSVSPDNLLPEEFDVTGPGEAPWGNRTVEAGDHVVNANGASTTPFTIVEPMNVLGTTWNETVLTNW